MFSKKLKKFVSIVVSAALLTSAVGTSAASAASGPASIKESTYSIETALKGGQVVDVSGWGTQNGTNIILYKCGGDQANQQFGIISIGNGYYAIMDTNSGKVLDVSGGIAQSGTNVQLYEWNGTAAQLWQFYSAGGGYYYIKNKLGYYLDACGGNSSNSTNIWVFSFNKTKAQKWKLVQIYSCPFGCNKSGTYFNVYSHCLTNGCFKNDPYLNAIWKAGKKCLTKGLKTKISNKIKITFPKGKH